MKHELGNAPCECGDGYASCQVVDGQCTQCGRREPTPEQGVWWCNSHNREATHFNKREERCCDRRLGGILLPCVVIFAPVQLEEMARCRTEIVTLRAEIKAKVAHIRLFQIDEEKLLSERDQLRQALEKHAQQWELVENAIPNEFEGSEETIGSIVATIVAQRDEAVQYRTGHLPHCDGFDYEQMRCACGYLDGTAYRELVGQVNVLHRQRNDAIEKARSDRAALAGLLPFVLESYYPNCATPEFKAAVEAAQEALLLEIRKQP